MVVASAGPATTGRPRGIGGELAEQMVVGAAADEVHHIDVLSGQGTGVVDRAPVGEGQAVENAADERGGSLGQWLATLSAGAGYPRGMSPGGRNAGSSTSMSDRNPGSRAASAIRPSRSAGSPARSKALMHSCRSQRPMTLRR